MKFDPVLKRNSSHKGGLCTYVNILLVHASEKYKRKKQCQTYIISLHHEVELRARGWQLCFPDLQLKAWSQISVFGSFIISGTMRNKYFAKFEMHNPLTMVTKRFAIM